MVWKNGGQDEEISGETQELILCQLTANNDGTKCQFSLESTVTKKTQVLNIGPSRTVNNLHWEDSHDGPYAELHHVAPLISVCSIIASYLLLA